MVEYWELLQSENIFVLWIIVYTLLFTLQSINIVMLNLIPMEAIEIGFRKIR